MHPDDVEPKSKEVIRRLTFVTNSLLMDMSDAPSIHDMFSWNVTIRKTSHTVKEILNLDLMLLVCQRCCTFKLCIVTSGAISWNELEYRTRKRCGQRSTLKRLGDGPAFVRKRSVEQSME
jgi:hypothetical protein